MKKHTILLILVSILLQGCATTGQSPNQWACAAAGALVGGAGAAGVEGEAEVALAGVAIGAALGYIACNQGEAAPAPEPKPAATPVPEPEPMPEPDTDGDGVIDKRDQCPGTARGTPVDSRGCPIIPSLKGVHFEFDKAMITQEGQAILNDAVTVLRQNPHVGINIVGHTDSRGSDEYNQNLSERRAMAVRSYLEAKGVSGNRMSTSGRGESEPVADNSTVQGRAMNRRVDITAHQM